MGSDLGTKVLVNKVQNLGRYGLLMFFVWAKIDLSF